MNLSYSVSCAHCDAGPGHSGPAATYAQSNQRYNLCSARCLSGCRLGGSSASTHSDHGSAICVLYAFLWRSIIRVWIILCSVNLKYRSKVLHTHAHLTGLLRKKQQQQADVAAIESAYHHNRDCWPHISPYEARGRHASYV